MAYCDWAKQSPLNQIYHDQEWGVPVHNDRVHFEYLSLEVLQCGLNWNMMLQKREIFRQCFNQFDPERIVQYTEDDIQRILSTKGMIRSERKIRAIIHNAESFCSLQKQCDSFSSYIWHFTEGKTILYTHHPQGYIPASNDLSDTIARDLKKHGFVFLGSIAVYAYLQACGIINDHDENCPCFNKIISQYPCIDKRRRLEKNVRYYGKEEPDHV